MLKDISKVARKRARIPQSCHREPSPLPDSLCSHFGKENTIVLKATDIWVYVSQWLVALIGALYRAGLEP